MALLLLFSAVLFATASGFALRSLLRLVRGSIESTTELALTMEVPIPTAGSKEIYLKGPRMTVTYGLWISLHDPGGNSVRLRRPIGSFGFSTGMDMNVGFALCKAPIAGIYTLTATMVPKSSRPMYIVVCKPIRLFGTLLGVAMVLSMALTMGSLVVSLVMLSRP